MNHRRLRLLIGLIAVVCASVPALQNLPTASAAVTTFTVTKVADTQDGECDSDCSLREAIDEANANANPAEQDIIEFEIPGAGPHIILTGSSLVITQAVHVMGESQDGASCAVPGRTLKIEVRASAADFNGIVTNHSGVRGTTISGLAVTGFGFSGISLGGGASFTVRCNNVGLQADGATALGNTDGIRALSSPSLVIGGDEASHRNVISANTSNGMVLLTSGGLVVQNNYIGLNHDGTAVFANIFSGMVVSSSQNIAIRENVISGSSGATGILIQGNSSNGTIQGNLIGYLADGTTPAPGPLALRIFAGDGITNSGHTVGGFGPGEANRIHVNGSTAVEVVVLDSGVSINNSIRGNSIRAVTLGIALSPVGEDIHTVTPNDTDDADDGPNRLQNYPVLTAVSTDGTVTGDLNSTPSSTFELDFFAGPLCSGRDGERYLGGKTVITDANGDVSFVATGLDTFLSTESITASATDAAGNTSEFSACLLPPARTVTGVSPAEAVAGSADTLVTVNGVAFVDGDQVRLNGNPVDTTFISSTQLQFTMTKAAKPLKFTYFVRVEGITQEALFYVTRSSSDIDCDGSAAATDALELLGTLAGIVVPVDACPDDANQSGGPPSIADVLHIRSELAGIIQPLKSLHQ